MSLIAQSAIESLELVSARLCTFDNYVVRGHIISSDSPEMFAADDGPLTFFRCIVFSYHCRSASPNKDFPIRSASEDQSVPRAIG